MDCVPQYREQCVLEEPSLPVHYGTGQTSYCCGVFVCSRSCENNYMHHFVDKVIDTDLLTNMRPGDELLCLNDVMLFNLSHCDVIELFNNLNKRFTVVTQRIGMAECLRFEMKAELISWEPGDTAEDGFDTMDGPCYSVAFKFTQTKRIFAFKRCMDLHSTTCVFISSVDSKCNLTHDSGSNITLVKSRRCSHLDRYIFDYLLYDLVMVGAQKRAIVLRSPGTNCYLTADTRRRLKLEQESSPTGDLEENPKEENVFILHYPLSSAFAYESLRHPGYFVAIGGEDRLVLKKVPDLASATETHFKLSEAKEEDCTASNTILLTSALSALAISR